MTCHRVARKDILISLSLPVSERTIIFPGLASSIRSNDQYASQHVPLIMPVLLWANDQACPGLITTADFEGRRIEMLVP